jgi:hypothetical protein
MLERRSLTNEPMDTRRSAMSPHTQRYMHRARSERSKAFHAGFAAVGAWLRRSFVRLQATAGTLAGQRR